MKKSIDNKMILDNNVSKCKYLFLSSSIRNYSLEEKELIKLTKREMQDLRNSLGNALSIYGKTDVTAEKEGLRILDGWGRIIFIVSNDGKRIGLELTERWERERCIDKREKGI